MTPVRMARRIARDHPSAGWLAILYAAVVHPLIAKFRSNEEAIAETAQMLARFQNAATMQAGIATQLNELRRRAAEQGYTLSGSTDALAAAELQDRIKMVVRESGGVVRSVQTLPPEDEESFPPHRSEAADDNHDGIAFQRRVLAGNAVSGLVHR